MWILTISALLLSTSALSANKESTKPNIVTPTIAMGAEIFSNRCTLCHGNLGMGEGLIATTLKNYPPTNLRKNKYGSDAKSLKTAIIYGGQRGTMLNAMPPFGDELTELEIESTVKFLSLYYSDINKAIKQIRKAKISKLPKSDRGRVIFQRRCALCHGKSGGGEGKMARIIKNPPPSNLTLSTAQDDYLIKLITTGGKNMGRSPQMPAFGRELSKTNIRSLLLYLKGLKRQVD